MEALTSLLSSIRDGRLGPVPSFSAADLVLSILTMGSFAPIGRKKLSKRLGIGEGATRTIVNKLKRRNLVQVDRRGCRLTQKGLALYRELTSQLMVDATPEIKDLKLGSFHVAVLVKRGGEKVKKGIEQRDAAVKEGAMGAVTLVYQDGVLFMPSLSNVSAEYPRFAKSILKKFRMESGDALIITGGETPKTALNGAIMAAITLLSDCQE